MTNSDVEASATVPAQRTIRVKDLVADIRLGMTCLEMMEKYKLSATGIQSAFKKLLATSAISPFEFTAWTALFCEPDDLNGVRLFPRNQSAFDLPIYETGDPHIKGRLVNFSATGIAVSGIEAEEGQIKTFIIPIKGAQVTFQARCRWVKSSEAPDEYLGGFEVVKVLRGNWEALGRLIASVMRRQLGLAKPCAAVPGPVGVNGGPGEQPSEPSPEVAGKEAPRSSGAEIEDEAKAQTPPEMKKAVTEPPQAATIEEGPTLEQIRACVDSDNYINLFTTGRNYLVFIMNPANFSDLSSEERDTMLGEVKQKNALVLSDLRKKAKAFQLAIEHSSLLVDL
jgi:hypothetical protein